jgi:antitoxin YefM
MRVLKASEVRSDLYNLIDSSGDEPILITGKRSNAVLLSESDWRAVQETLYLLSVPGMRNSIRQGLRTPVKKLSATLRW